MPLGTTAALLLGVGAAGAGVGISNMMSKTAKQATSPIPLPQAPKVEDAAEKANAVRRKTTSTQTVFTNPLGIAGQADVTKKVLLGQ